MSCAVRSCSSRNNNTKTRKSTELTFHRNPQMFQIPEQDLQKPYEIIYNVKTERTDYEEDRDIVIEENEISLHESCYMSNENLSQYLPPIATSEVLSNEEYAGPYGFDISLVPTQNSKNPWMYSSLLNKIYSDMNQAFPVDFRVERRPEGPVYIRITPQYCAQHFANEAVCRCLAHEHYLDSTNKQIPEHARQHVMRCANPRTQYVGNAALNERLSVILPLGTPQVGNETVRELFHFVCKISCSAPGMNRRGIELIFTLENEEHEIVGRRCLNVRICSCPKRDKDKEEKESVKNDATPPNGRKRELNNIVSDTHSKKVPKLAEDMNTYNLNLKLTGKHNVLKLLDRAEEIYLSNAYKLRDRPEEEEEMRKNVAAIDAARRQIQ